MIDLSASVIKSALWLNYLNSTYSGINFEMDLPGYNDRADFLALDYLSRQVLLIEVKRTKADFKKGLEKFEPYYTKAHLCYVATPSGLLLPEDIPEGWGLIELGSDIHALTIVKEAELHMIPAPFFDFYARKMLEKYRDSMMYPPAIEKAYNRQVLYGPPKQND